MTRPLEGVRILDFCWIGAGSYTTKLLADLGADVIKIESSRKPDTLRLARPFKDGRAGVNRSGYFADRNTSKRSITLNLKCDEGVDIARRLVCKADVVTNNFSPGVMQRLGLGYESLRAVNPTLVYMSMSMQGADGPKSGMKGYGLVIAADIGLFDMTGLPEREPSGTGTNYPDHIPNPTHAAFAIIAALFQRRQTGRGQNIDIAQMEPPLAMLGPILMDYFANGHVQHRAGNRNENYLLQGVYRCLGEDKWVSLSVRTVREWQALARALHLPEITVDPEREASHEFAVRAEPLLAKALAGLSDTQIVDTLQRCGIAAGYVYDAREVVERDAQFRYRNHWVKLSHSEMGTCSYNNSPYRFSAADVAPRSAAPLLGQHTRDVCGELLEMSAEEITKLVDAGVLI